MQALFPGRALSGLGRYWAFWLPWILVACLAPLREVAQVNLAPESLKSKFQDATGDAGVDEPIRQVGQSDLDGLLSNCYRVDGYSNNPPVEAARIVALEALTHRFPAEHWLACVHLRCALDSAVSRTDQELAHLEKMAALAEARDPGNAFPAYCAVRFYYDRVIGGRPRDGCCLTEPELPKPSLEQQNQFLRLLHIAAGKSRYEEGNNQLKEHLLRFRERMRFVSLEEKYTLLASDLSYSVPARTEPTDWAMHRAQAMLKTGDACQALRVALDTAHLGALMGRSIDFRFGGSTHVFLRDQSYLLCEKPDWEHLETPAQQVQAPLLVQMEALAHSCGTPEASTQMAGYWNQINKVDAWYSTLNVTGEADDGHWLSVGWGRNCGLWIVYQILAVLPCYFLATALSFRVSITDLRGRHVAFLAWGASLLALLIARWYWMLSVAYLAADNSARNFVPPTEQVKSTAVLFCVAPACIAWLFCGLFAWLRYRQQPVRFGSALPQRFEPITLAAPIALIFSVWWLWFWMAHAAPATFDVPPTRSEITGLPSNLEWGLANVAGLAFSAFQLTLGPFIWMAGWRWMTSQEGRPVSTAVFFGWKRSVGAYLVLLSWMYLFVGLVHIAPREEAKRQFQRELHLGEFDALRERMR